MGNSAIGRGTAVEENKVKASSGDSSPGFLEDKVDGSTIQVIGNQLVGSSSLTESLFLVRPTTSQLNLAVSPNIVIIFGTEIFDIGNNFASNLFTAPVTGQYLLTFNLILQNIDSVCTGVNTRIVTSNRSYNFNITPNTLLAADTALYPVGGSVVADMDASDTAFIQTQLTAGAAQMDINTSSHFSGILLNE